MEIAVPDVIVCVDCGGVCHRLTAVPEEGFVDGAIVAFRCEDCLDRWDIEFDSQDGEA